MRMPPRINASIWVPSISVQITNVDSKSRRGRGERNQGE
jgi:hypothetical protein